MSSADWPQTESRALVRGLIQTLLISGAIVMSVWARPPWLGAVGLGLLTTGLLGAAWFGDRQSIPIACAWGGTAAIIAGVFLARIYTLDRYHAVIAWQLAAAGALATRSVAGNGTKRQWKILATGWGFLGTGLWLAAAYRDNLPDAFHAGLVLNLALLVICRCWFQMPPAGIQLVNTMALLLIGLPLADLLVRPSYRPVQYLAPATRPFSYAAAHKDPATFARWCRCYLAQWDQMAGGIFMDDPARVVPVRLRPGGAGKLFDSRITINSHGFRGKEFALDKGRAFRIVAMGESTTFGCTINPGEKPWPELLEELIRDRLHPDRPVEVINAGVPANHLGHALYRLPLEILPLKPDLIISYHGYNGFGFLRPSLPTSFGRIPPAYQQRPLKLLADCEYRLKVLFYKRHVIAERQRTPPDLTDPMKTIYADQYRHFVQAVETNGIRLVLANFSMALNRHSDPDVVAFYRTGYPSAYWQIRANEVHSVIVENFARQHPDICFIDTHPGLDGEHEKFIDLVHLTQEGRQQLAENIFAGIKPMLERELAGHGAPGS